MSTTFHLQFDRDKCFCALTDETGALVTGEELRTEGWSRSKLLWEAAYVVRSVVERSPEAFAGIALEKGVELRGPEPFPGFLNELQSLCGYRIQVQEVGGGR